MIGDLTSIEGLVYQPGVLTTLPFACVFLQSTDHTKSATVEHV